MTSLVLNGVILQYLVFLALLQHPTSFLVILLGLEQTNTFIINNLLITQSIKQNAKTNNPLHSNMAQSKTIKMHSIQDAQIKVRKFSQGFHKVLTSYTSNTL